MAIPALKACALRSGSSGNAVFVGSGRTRLLIDAGVCCRSIEQSLQAIGESADNLDGLLVTHEHSDHISGVGPLLRKYKIPLYVNLQTWLAMRNIIGPISDSKVSLIDASWPTVVGDLSIACFSTPHDAVDSVGFCIEGASGSLAVLTDAGYLEEKALLAVAGCKAIFIEANYDHAMLLAGTYPEMLKQRILSRHGHLSNDDCAAAVCYLMEKGTNRFILSHISRDNNYPELALLVVNSKLYEMGAQPDRDFQISVAQRFTVSEPFCF
jgi:phosphoribosyl 1,2-cyclic phosphodiesterase